MFYSYAIYICTVISAVFFAFLAQKFQGRSKDGTLVPHPLFAFLTILPLFFIMGFRDISVGVDGYNYLSGYIYANSVSVSEYYSNNVTEPFFYLLYRISYLLGDVQWLFIISAFITVSLFFKSFTYEINKISLPLTILFFSTIHYFYYFGIMRMGIAVSIIAFSYRYIIEGNKKKFLLLVFVATMFHYSALFALIFLMIGQNKENLFKKSNLLKLMIIVPLSFFVTRILIFPFITANRYQNYIETDGVISLAFLSSLPILGIFLIHYNKLVKESRNYHFYFLLFVISVVTEIFSPLIGIGRMIWYVNLSLVFLFPAVIKVNKNKAMKIFWLLLMIIYASIYSYNAYFGDSFRGLYMLPYKTFF